MKYERRVIDDLLDEHFLQLPAILLDGPKAIGKTSTALQRSATEHRLDVEPEYQRAMIDPDWAITGSKPVLIDEWHRVPKTWDSVKRAVDLDSSAGQFLLTGSMPSAQTHSGAGRITALRMRPLSFFERGIEQASVSMGDLLGSKAEIVGDTKVSVNDYADEMLQSGLPGLRKLTGGPLIAALDGYLSRIVDTDIEEMGLAVKRTKSLSAWLAAYAAATGTSASWERIRDASQAGFDQLPARSTVLAYRDALLRLRILDELPAWLPTQNQLIRVAQSEKHYLADTALAMRLLNFNPGGIQVAQETRFAPQDRPLFGRMFESLAVQSIRVYAERHMAKVMHYRDPQGRREVDLIITAPFGGTVAMEIKLATAPTMADAKHLLWLRRELGEELVAAVVVHAGPYAYEQDGVAFVPLALLGP